MLWSASPRSVTLQVCQGATGTDVLTENVLTVDGSVCSTRRLSDGRFQLVSRVRWLFSREAQPFPTGRKPPHHIGFAVVGNRMTFVAVRSVGCGLVQIDKLDRARKQGNTRARRAPNRER